MSNTDNLDKEIEEGLAQAEKMLRRQRLFISVGILLALGAAAFGANIGYENHQQVRAERTATAQQLRVEQTATQRPIQTATAKVHQTATAQQLYVEQTMTREAQKNATSTAIMSAYFATQTKRAEPTVTARAKVDSAFSELQRVVLAYTGDLSNATFRFYDANGKLTHIDDGYIESYCSPYSKKNFVVKVEFHNPYSSSEHDWDYGIMFRETADKQYRLALLSNQSWTLGLRNEDDWNLIENITLGSSLNLGSGQSNVIYLVVSGNQGYFFVNEEYISTLNLSQNNVAGDICVATGMYEGYELKGKTTSYSDFTIWSLP
jgi:hypothetical protein